MASRIIKILCTALLKCTLCGSRRSITLFIVAINGTCFCALKICLVTLVIYIHGYFTRALEEVLSNHSCMPVLRNVLSPSRLFPLSFLM